MKKRVVYNAFCGSLPMLAGYLFMGSGFGIMLAGIGYGPLWALFMSITIYTGTMQYVAVSLIDGGVSLIVAALTTLTINIRNMFYNLSMYDYYKDAGWKKPILALTITDESFSILCDGKTPKGDDPHTYRMLVSLFGYLYWILGGLLGNIAGTLLPFDFTGVEFSMTALFVAVFVEQWTSTKEHRPAVAGLAITALSFILIGEKYFLIGALLGITLTLAMLRNSLEERGKLIHG